LGETKNSNKAGSRWKPGGIQLGRNQEKISLGETKNEGSEKNLKPAQAREGAKPSSEEKTWKKKSLFRAELCLP
jgi:hypothetical protein